MKTLCVLAITLLAVVNAKETYTTENDDLDIEGVVADPKTFEEYLKCFTNKGQCNEVNGAFKKDMQETFQQACAKCTDAQKHLLKVFITALKEKMPSWHDDFIKTYDPDNKYFAALESVIANA